MGVGPCYSTKAARSGMQMWESLSKETFDRKLRFMAAGYQKRYGSLLNYSVDDEIKKFDSFREHLHPFIVNGVQFIKEAEAAAKGRSDPSILVEGANALMLDICFGTYPYCTSSNTNIGGAFTGTALSHSIPKEVIGVVKAYTTRVGAGPLPTEELDADRQPEPLCRKLQSIGREFGVTSGRRRRCGWLDLVIVKYSTAINDYTALNLTKLDVLDTFDEIKVATAYKIDGEVTTWFPADHNLLDRAEVVYVTLPGWQSTTTGITRWEDLPENAKRYVEFIEGSLGGGSGVSILGRGRIGSI